MCGPFANGDSLSLVFHHRLSAVMGALFPLKISFCPLAGLIQSHVAAAAILPTARCSMAYWMS
jgi:hypothetical protein